MVESPAEQVLGERQHDFAAPLTTNPKMSQDNSPMEATLTLSFRGGLDESSRTTTPKGSCIQQWVPPFLLIPLSSAAALAASEENLNGEKEPRLGLPGYEPCRILSQCANGRLLQSSSSCTEVESKRWKNIIRKLRRDGSSQAFCMLATLEMVLANEKVQEVTLHGESAQNNFSHNATIVTGGEETTEIQGGDINRNWCLQEGWTFIQDKISFPDCCRLYQQIARQLHLMTLPHPLLAYATKGLFALTGEQFELAMSIFYSKHWIQRLEQTELTTDTQSTTMNRLRASHLLQEYVSTLPSRVVGVLLEEPLVISSDTNRVQPLNISCLKTPSLFSIPSSCLPNSLLELQAAQVFNLENGSQQLTGQLQQERQQIKIQCSLISLYDLEPGDEPTVATSSTPFWNRETCCCPRCQYERCDPDGGTLLLRSWTKSPHGLRQIIQLGHAYFQDGNYEEAKRLYRLCHETFAARICAQELPTSKGVDDNGNESMCIDKDDNSTNHPKTSEDHLIRQAANSWHSIGAVKLTQNNFIDAQRHWSTSNPLYQKHCHGLALQLKKQVAYQYLEARPVHATTNQNDTTNAKTTKPFDTTTTNQEGGYAVEYDCYNVAHGSPSGVLVTSYPIVSSSTCQKLIQWAHAHVAASTRGGRSTESGDGWTTNRHYAVPTTDIAIHESPKLLSWFQEFMTVVGFPLLHRQFCDASPTTSTKQRFYVHDAFLVRYSASDAGKDAAAATSSPGNYLPLHFDESTHSFVLALNNEFEGGGTYFYRLDKTILPPATGSMVSFRGNQWLHGGSVVTSGVRYIIAAFLYLDIDSSVEGMDKTADFPPRATKASTLKEGSSRQGDNDTSMAATSKRQKTQLSSQGGSFSFGFF
jgi:hypothetical protein